MEMTLRGTFQDSAKDGDGAAVDSDGEGDQTPPEGDQMPHRPATSVNFPVEEDGDSMRARAGFGRGEGGAVPSGRCSIPGVRAGGGSAPPLLNTVRHGIEMGTLELAIEQHVRRILGAQARAHSIDPPGSDDGSQTEATNLSWTPAFCSPPRSLCSSPDPGRGRTPDPSRGRAPDPSRGRALSEDGGVTVGIFVRLCRSRCGSSSAILELVLDHCSECAAAAAGVRGELWQCSCRPTPMDGEAKLLAYFVRHSLLRLTTLQLPVRVQLELLPGEFSGECGAGRSISIDAGHSRAPSDLPTLPEEPSDSPRRRGSRRERSDSCSLPVPAFPVIARHPRAALYCPAYL